MPFSFAAEFLDLLLYWALTYFILLRMSFALSFFAIPNAGFVLLVFIFAGPSFFYEDELIGGFWFDLDFEPPVSLSIAYLCLYFSAGENYFFFMSVLVDLSEAESVCLR